MIFRFDTGVLLLPFLLLGLIGCGHSASSGHPPGYRGELELHVLQPASAYVTADEMRRLIADGSPRLDPVARFPVLWAEEITGMGRGTTPLRLTVEVDATGTLEGRVVDLGDFTETYTGHQVAFVYDGELLSAAVVEGRLEFPMHFSGPDREAFSEQEAADLAGRMQQLRPRPGQEK